MAPRIPDESEVGTFEWNRDRDAMSRALTGKSWGRLREQIIREREAADWKDKIIRSSDTRAANPATTKSVNLGGGSDDQPRDEKGRFTFK